MDKGCQNNLLPSAAQFEFVHLQESELLHADNPKDL